MRLALALCWTFPLQLWSQSTAALDAMLRAEVDSGFSGLVLIAVGDSVILERAYASPSAHLDTATAFWVGSITKGCTAAAILTLQESGRLSVRDSIPRFFRDVPTDKRAIHSILAQGLAYAPGGGYQYMNDDYNLLAAVIEIASGQTYEAYVESRLLVRRVSIIPDSGVERVVSSSRLHRIRQMECRSRYGVTVGLEPTGAIGAPTGCSAPLAISIGGFANGPMLS